MAIFSGSQMQHKRQENISGVGDAGLTQDFLGLGGSGNLDMSSETYNADVTALSYSDKVSGAYLLLPSVISRLCCIRETHLGILMQTFCSLW
jgi:hypothetical protein